ncbi:MAG: VCBS repeat-containing protein [Saprospiraceae bacterium]|nr:VCBS repeat-containing protein [Saprospiraceae bacterium]
MPTSLIQGFLALLIVGISLQDKALAQTRWKQYTIDDSASGADGIKLADLNSDGLLDLVVGWEEEGITKMYVHPDSQHVRERWPSFTLGRSPQVEDVAIIDMNGDGRLEIISCSEGTLRKILVHRNQTEDGRLSGGNWSTDVLPASDDLMMWMYAQAVQIDEVHGLDLVAAGKGKDASIGWFRAPMSGQGLDAWEWHRVAPVGWIMSIIAHDMDRDGDMDLVISDRRGAWRGCRWLENPGKGFVESESWKDHLIGSSQSEIMFISMADVDGDESLEIVTCERTEQTISIYIQADPLAQRWREEVYSIPPWTGAAKSVAVGDLNRDGTADFVLSANTNGAEKSGLIWLDGSIAEPRHQDWREIAGRHNAKFDKVELIDLNLDGYLDVLICEENYGENSNGLGVIWYENPFGNGNRNGK